jgi:hypothetical protein
MNIRLPCVLVVLQLTALAAMAHPVAQGAMEIVVGADSIDIRARVSNEEAFIAEAFGQKTDANTALDDVWRRHGEYLLAHVHLTADGTPLTGRVASIIAPGRTTPEDRITYDLRFDFPKDRHRPGAIVLRQDVLNEFIFAPGNRWEASYIVRISRQERLVAQGLLFTSRQPLAFTCNWNVAATQSVPSLDQRAMAIAFVRYGIQHILGGYDHLLFVAGLVLAVASIWDLVKVVTAFTLAHTLTLTLAVLDVVRLSNRIVEPMIAASIVFVALQNLFAPSRSRGLMRLAVAFGFGLFHGLGFAGGLLTAMEGMAGVAIITAIGGFSFGVEIGHQLVALPLFGVMKIMRSYRSRAADPEWILHWTLRVGSSVICAAGLVYLVAALR